jgi:hypothetical protein
MVHTLFLQQNISSKNYEIYIFTQQLCSDIKQ